jgi:predicted  nucleic acid-binding Zn-ribbon protein
MALLSDSDRRTLLELRVFDWDMDRLRERAQVLPRELERLDKELGVHRRILEDQQRILQDLRLDRRAAEREVENAKQQRRSLEEQQYKIRNNQQYQANLREIENMKQKASQYEEKAIEILVQEEEVLKEIERLQAVVDEEKRKYELAAGGLRTEFDEVKQELTAKDTERSQTIDRLSPQIRSKYERIRRSKGELAIVAVADGACGGCGYALPPQRVQEVRRNNSLILCEGCGRILVWPSENTF